MFRVYETREDIPESKEKLTEVDKPKGICMSHTEYYGISVTIIVSLVFGVTAPAEKWCVLFLCPAFSDYRHCCHHSGRALLQKSAGIFRQDLWQLQHVSIGHCFVFRRGQKRNAKKWREKIFLLTGKNGNDGHQNQFQIWSKRADLHGHYNVWKKSLQINWFDFNVDAQPARIFNE